MNGLELSREYFFNVAAPELRRGFPELYPRLAAGLAGNGSECFGYDDEISRDHDWGVDFYIWTEEGDKDFIPSLIDWKTELLGRCPPEFPRTCSEYGARIGVMTRGEFYSGLIGAPEGPKTLNEWLRAPDENFAMAVNGAVFIDGAGKFTQIRDYLLEYFPEDIRRKRIAAKCMALAQTGQYNHGRTAKRRDWVTLRTVLSKFADAAISLAFLLNKTYRPYYKWAFRALKDLAAPGDETARLLMKIAESGGLDNESFSERHNCISELCKVFARELRAQGLSDSDDWFMASHGEDVKRGINDEFLRSLPTQYEI